MEKTITKISFAVFVISAIIWLGAVNVRAVIGNELLHFGTLEFKSDLHPEMEREIFRLIGFATIFVMIGYPLALVSSIVFIATTSLKMKEEGWLMMSAILFFIFVPVEIYTLALDWKMIGLNFWGNWELIEFRKVFIHRLTALSGAPIIALLCYYTIIVIAVFRPFKHIRNS